MNAVADFTPYDALFANVSDALTFAYNQSISIRCSLPGTESGGGGKGLGGLDGAGQAGMIRAEVERLAPVRKSIIVARYCAHRQPCTCNAVCCSGYRPNEEWVEAIGSLSKYVMKALSGMITHYHMRRGLVMRYFGEKVSFTDIASRCRVDSDTASAHNEKIVAFLRGEERMAGYEIEGKLKMLGMVE